VQVTSSEPGEEERERKTENGTDFWTMKACITRDTENESESQKTSGGLYRRTLHVR